MGTFEAACRKLGHQSSAVDGVGDVPLMEVDLSRMVFFRFGGLIYISIDSPAEKGAVFRWLIQCFSIYY